MQILFKIANDFFFYLPYCWQRGLWLYVIIMSRTCFRVNLKEYKDLYTRNRGVIWSLNERNRIQTHNHLVRKGTLNHLA